MRFWFRTKRQQWQQQRQLLEAAMAISDQLAALNQNLSDLKTSVDAAVAALQAAAAVPAGLEQTLADANTGIAGATAALKAATPTA